jgi:hypothetical protein
MYPIIHNIRKGVRELKPSDFRGFIKKPGRRLFIRVIQKLQFLNNNRLKTAKCGALKPCGFLAGLVSQPTVSS